MRRFYKVTICYVLVYASNGFILCTFLKLGAPSTTSKSLCNLKHKNGSWNHIHHLHSVPINRTIVCCWQNIIAICMLYTRSNQLGTQSYLIILPVYIFKMVIFEYTCFHGIIELSFLSLFCFLLVISLWFYPFPSIFHELNHDRLTSCRSHLLDNIYYLFTKNLDEGIHT